MMKCISAGTATLRAKHQLKTADILLKRNLAKTKKKAWTNPICMDGMPFVKNGEFMFDITRTKLCAGWCGVSSTATQSQCIVGDEVKQKLDACCAGFQCNRAGLPKCKF